MVSNRQAVIGTAILCAAIAGLIVVRVQGTGPISVPDAAAITDSKTEAVADTAAAELVAIPAEEMALTPLQVEASTDARAVAHPVDPASNDANFYPRKVLTQNLPKLGAPDCKLDSVSVRLVLYQSIALSLDAQGRGVRRTKDKSMGVQPQPGQQHFMYNGVTYMFEPNEFPEFDTYTRNRKNTLSEAEVSDVIALVRKRGESVLASLPPVK